MTENAPHPDRFAAPHGTHPWQSCSSTRTRPRAGWQPELAWRLDFVTVGRARPFDRTRESFNCAAGGKYFNANDKHNLQNRTTPDISPALRAHSFARWPRASVVSEDNRNGRARQPVTKASRQTAAGEAVC